MVDKTNMEKEFIPYDRALRLKKLGFDEPCFGFWKSNIKYQRFIADYGCNRDLGGMFGRDAKLIPTAPTFSQAFRWFREKGIYSFAWKAPVKGYFFNIDQSGGWDCFNTYEEAELACLDNLIQIVEKAEVK